MAEKIGEIDIDTLKAQYSIEMANRKIERMQNVVTSADKRMRAWEKTWGAISRVAGAFGVALGVQQLGQYLISLKDLGKELEAKRAQYSSGSQAAREFNEATGSFTDEQAVKLDSLGRKYDNFFLKVKIGAANLVGGFAEYLSDQDPDISVEEAVRRSGPGVLATKNKAKAPTPPPNTPELSKQIIAAEDELAKLREEGTIDLSKQRGIIEQELRLDKMRLEYAQKFGGSKRQEENAAREAAGAAKKALNDEKFARDQEIEGARTQSELMGKQLSGQQNAAKFVEIRLKYERQIAEALRLGKTELAGHLKLQKELEEIEARRVGHTMTPRERLEERRNQRRINRENKQTGKAETEFQSRWDRGVRPETPGSEFHNWAKRKGLINPGAGGNNGAMNSGPTPAQTTKLLADVGLIARAFSDAK